MHVVLLDHYHNLMLYTELGLSVLLSDGLLTSSSIGEHACIVTVYMHVC